MKAEIVAADEREEGDRALLNFGHTFGHALETPRPGSATRLLHGEAVALGMVLAFDFSARLGLCRAARTRRGCAAISTAMGLPTEIAPADRRQPALRPTLLGHMGKDKKVRDGRITLILPRRIGDAFVSGDVAPAQLEAFLADAVARGRNARPPAHP